MYRPYYDNWLLKGGKKSTPINRIPDDILYMIFRMVVIGMWQWKATVLLVEVHISFNANPMVIHQHKNSQTNVPTCFRQNAHQPLWTYTVCHRWKSAALIVPRPSIAELNASIRKTSLFASPQGTVEDYAEHPTYTAFFDAPMLCSIAFDVNWWDKEEDDMLLQSPNYVPHAGRHLTIQRSVAAATNLGSIYITSLTIDAWNINPPGDGKDWLLGMSFPLLVELNRPTRIVGVVWTSAGILRLSLVTQSIDAICTGDNILRIIRTANTPTGLTELEVAEIWLHYGVHCPGPGPRLITDSLLVEMKSEEFLPELASLRFVWTFHWGDDDENDPDFAEHRVGLWEEPAMADKLRTRCVSGSSKTKSVVLARNDKDEISEEIVDVLRALRTMGIHTRLE
ncbi:hypothetical protein EDD85DRAFT_788079 [Armillaria nabsnona]|nr:hypothetical protein EDD85DRAFT_788079 [Armillaria nabsnona]